MSTTTGFNCRVWQERDEKEKKSTSYAVCIWVWEYNSGKKTRASISSTHPLLQATDGGNDSRYGTQPFASKNWYLT